MGKFFGTEVKILRKLLMVFCLILISMPALASETKVNLPDAKGGFYYCFVDKDLKEGVSSEILSVDIFTVEVGAVGGACLLAGGIKLVDLERFGLKYKWAKIINVTAGGWLGYNFEKAKIKGGLYASLIKVKF